MFNKGEQGQPICTFKNRLFIMFLVFSKGKGNMEIKYYDLNFDFNL